MTTCPTATDTDLSVNPLGAHLSFIQTRLLSCTPRMRTKSLQMAQNAAAGILTRTSHPYSCQRRPYGASNDLKNCKWARPVIPV